MIPVTELLKIPREVLRRAFSRLARIKRVCDAKRGGGRWHDLEHALRASLGHGVRVEVALDRGDGGQHPGRQSMFALDIAKVCSQGQRRSQQPFVFAPAS